jgi:hypothetical protein
MSVYTLEKDIFKLLKIENPIFTPNLITNMATENKKQAWLLSDSSNVFTTFKLRTVSDCQYLTDWQNATGVLEPFEKQWLALVRQDLLKSWNVWNEEELKMQAVSSIMRAAHLEIPQRIRTFYERPMTGTLLDIPLNVNCDCFVATPDEGGKPTKPYFFFQEFKRTKGDKNDPEAQMLIAMLLAQNINNDQKPIYGAWLQGRIWNFNILNEKEYCTGKAYDATDETQLFQVVYILQKLKNLILER